MVKSVLPAIEVEKKKGQIGQLGKKKVFIGSHHKFHQQSIPFFNKPNTQNGQLILLYIFPSTMTHNHPKPFVIKD